MEFCAHVGASDVDDVDWWVFRSRTGSRAGKGRQVAGGEQWGMTSEEAIPLHLPYSTCLPYPAPSTFGGRALPPCVSLTVLVSWWRGSRGDV